MTNHSSINVYFDGGIIDGDRVRCIFSTYDVVRDDFKIRVLKIEYNKKFYSINHRAVLGSIMSLGIKRECIGDILITDNSDAYFSCTEEIYPYIKENLQSIGRASIKLVDVNENIYNKINYETKTYFLSSLRLDVTVCAMYNFSRREVNEILETGDIYVNQILNQNPSHILKENDVISVRHKGKFKVEKIGGNSKSGRYIVDLAKRV